MLWGTEDGQFKPAETLKGTDDEPLIIPADEENMVDKICTRPTAADIDDDGDLDLLVGNFRGTFYLFEGEGKGKFAPKPTLVSAAEDKNLTVASHSDPFLVDWDADGDLDLLSGSARGGVYLAMNNGSAATASFTEFEELYPPAGHSGSIAEIDGLKGPQSDTRVWAADVNNDGKLDVLVGDSLTLTKPKEGMTEEEIAKAMAEIREQQQELSKEAQEIMSKYEEEAAAKRAEAAKENGEEEGEAEADAKRNRRPDPELMKLIEPLQKKMMKLYERQQELSNTERTGLVWVLYQN